MLQKPDKFLGSVWRLKAMLDLARNLLHKMSVVRC